MTSVDICPNPVFVIGSPRSGTTILAESLATHSAFSEFGESQILCDLFAGGRLDANYRRSGRPDGSWLVRRAVSRTEFLRCIGLGVNALFTRVSQGRRWVDQTPNYTLFVDTVAEMFPGAYFLHIIRDGRRVVHSMMHYRLTAEPWTKDFGEACRTWHQFVTQALDFDARQPGRCLTVVNEALSASPRENFARILRFLDASPEPGPADFFSNNRIHSSFPNAVAKNQTEQSREDPWQLWSADEQTVFNQLAGDCYMRFRGLLDRALTADRPPDSPNELTHNAGQEDDDVKSTASATAPQ
jgi:hypothetical protein